MIKAVIFDLDGVLVTTRRAAFCGMEASGGGAWNIGLYEDGQRSSARCKPHGFAGGRA